ncbi:MAG: hypothetical protein ABFD21_07055, partial [Anaerolineaceae bacterium]
DTLELLASRRQLNVLVLASQAADAVVLALEQAQARARGPVCAENLIWREFLQRWGKILGKPKPILTLPKALESLGAWFITLTQRMLGREGAPDLVPFVDLQTRLAFLDPDYSAREPGMRTHGPGTRFFVNLVRASRSDCRKKDE